MKKEQVKSEVEVLHLFRLFTHLLRNIFANSDVECIVRAKTLQLNLTGVVGRPEVKNCAKGIFLRPC